MYWLVIERVSGYVVSSCSQLKWRVNLVAVGGLWWPTPTRQYILNAMRHSESGSPHLFFATGLRWTAPPNWPEVPQDWTPTVDWRPDPALGPPRAGWAFLRLSDCAADTNLPLEYRDEELDQKLGPFIANPGHPPRAFVNFLGQIADIVSAAFKVTGEVERVGRSYRDLALRSVSDATDVLERAERLEKARHSYSSLVCRTP